MRYRVIASTGTDSISYPDKEHVANFYHRQHAEAFCDRLVVCAFVLDCYDDMTIHRNIRYEQ